MGFMAGGLVGWALILFLQAPAQDPLLDLRDRARAFADPAQSTTTQIFELGKEIWTHFASGAPVDREIALSTIEAVQTAFRAHKPSKGDAVERDATSFAWWSGACLRDAEHYELAAEVFAQQAAQAGANEPLRPYLWIELATTRRMQARYRDAHSALDEAQKLLVPLGVDPFQHHPADSEQALYLGSWFDVTGDVLMHEGVLEAAHLHFEELARRAEAHADNALRFAGLHNRMRLALVAHQPALVRSLWHEATPQSWFSEISAVDAAKLDVVRGAAALDAAERGERNAFDEARTVLDSVASRATASEQSRRFASLMAVMVELVRSRIGEANALLAAVNSRYGSPLAHDTSSVLSESNLWHALLALRIARLLGSSDELRASRQIALRLLEAQVEEWRSQRTGGHSQKAFTHATLRNSLAAELVKAEVNTGSGDSRVANALNLWIRVHSSGHAGVGNDLGSRDLALEGVQKLRSSLATRSTAVVVLIPERFESCLFWFDDREIEFDTIAPFYQLESAARRLDATAQLCASSVNPGDWSEYRQAVASASAMFLPPGLRAFLANHSELVIFGAEDVAWPSFELFEIADGEPLGLQLALCYTPSLVDGMLLAKAWDSIRPERSGSCVVVSPAWQQSVLSEALPDLPLDSAEQVLVSRMLRASGTSKSRLLHGSSATAGLVFDESLEDSAALTIITHGIFDPLRADPAGLLLAPDGTHDGAVWASDMERIGVPPVVSLFACRVGLAHPRRYDMGGHHLGRSMLDSGALAILLNTSEIEYRVSLELGAEFHEHLARGHSPTQALRLARLNLVPPKQSSEAAVPIHALLVKLYGYGAKPLPVRAFDPELSWRGGSAKQSCLIGIVAAILAALAFVWIRKKRLHGR